MLGSRTLQLIKNNLRFTHSSTNVNAETSATVFPRKIFSGIQPTGSIHLGNYLGAIIQWVKLQEKETNMTLSIVDLHSMTLPHKPLDLSRNVLEMTATLLACGIDPDKVTLFQQSTLHQHTELCWYLGCIATMARLKHLPQYKEKSANLRDIPLGLFIYPVLQAADILAHKATLVPVGEDQLQHLQLAQDLARMFNARFGNAFPIPHSLITETAKIKSLRDPSKKMSKSDPDSKSCIYLTDKFDAIVKKVKRAVTDFTSEVTYDPEARPGVSNLITIHSALSGKSFKDICKEVKTLNTGNYKIVVAEEIQAHISPIREKYFKLMSEPQYLLDVLELGREKAAAEAEETLQDVRQKLGLELSIDSLKEKIEVNI